MRVRVLFQVAKTTVTKIRKLFNSIIKKKMGLLLLLIEVEQGLNNLESKFSNGKMKCFSNSK